MEVIAYDPFIAADRAQRMQVKLLELDELFRTADYVTLHIPRTKDTENLVNAELLRTMKPTARIVNCARGGVVDEAAIAEAINNGVIAGAGLDVYASEPLAEDSPLRAVERAARKARARGRARARPPAACRGPPGGGGGDEVL